MLPARRLTNKQEVLSHTETNHPEYNSLKSMLKSLEGVANHITLSKKDAMNIKKLLDLQQCLVGLKVPYILKDICSSHLISIH